MRESELSQEIAGKYILCSCEGTAEEQIMKLLLEHGKLCFGRDDLVEEKFVRVRKGKDLASQFLNRDYGNRGIVILRILDRYNEKLVLPKEYVTKNIPIFDIITKPEIEILHIIAENASGEYSSARKHKKDLKPSEFCQGYFAKKLPPKIKSVKSEKFIEYMYGTNIDKLISAIKAYHHQVVSEDFYTLNDLLLS